MVFSHSVVTICGVMPIRLLSLIPAVPVYRVWIFYIYHYQRAELRWNRELWMGFLSSVAYLQKHPSEINICSQNIIQQYNTNVIHEAHNR